MAGNTLRAVMSPADRAKIEADAAAERARLHQQGFEAGQRHAERIKAVAFMALGFIAGGASMGLYFAAMGEKAQITTSAIIDRVLQRVQEAPPPVPNLTTRDAAEAQMEAENKTGSCSMSVPAAQRPPHCFRGERR